MSVDIPADPETDDRVEELATRLGEAIAQLPEYERFLDAKEDVESSEAAQEKLREFEQVRQSFALARQTGDATQQDLRELQAVQESLHDVPAMADYLAAQSDLEQRLQDLDERISESLAVEFGETARECCQE